MNDFERLRQVEETLAAAERELAALAVSQADTALEGMLLTAQAAAIGARASLADARLVWDEHHSPDEPEDEVPAIGYCPTCSARGVVRERRPNGNDRCANGHVYPSSKAVFGAVRWP